MKKTIFSFTAVITALVMLFSFASCGNDVENTGLWEKATYLSDTEFGKGAKTIQVEVRVEEQSVTFTINTDKATLGEALKEHNLVSGEEGDYGLYIKTVNGILADYDIDQSYWSPSKDGTALTTGVDQCEISDGEHYELTYTKG